MTKLQEKKFRKKKKKKRKNTPVTGNSIGDIGLENDNLEIQEKVLIVSGNTKYTSLNQVQYYCNESYMIRAVKQVQGIFPVESFL